MVTIRNAAGEVVDECRSDAEACRWYALGGRRGDYIAETGEDLADVVADLFPNADPISYDRNGCVVAGDLGDEPTCAQTSHYDD